MRKALRILLLVAMLAMFANSAAWGNEKNSAPPPTSLTGITIGKAAPNVSLAVKPDRVAVYVLGASRELLQELPYDPASLPELTDDERVELADMNFDGYVDVKVMSSRGNANVYYDCWLWDQAERKFVLHKELSKITSPRLEADIKMISSFTHISATDRVEATYRFEGDKLRQLTVAEWTYDKDSNFILSRHYEVDANGARRLVREAKVMPARKDDPRAVGICCTSAGGRVVVRGYKVVNND